MIKERHFTPAFKRLKDILLERIKDAEPGTRLNSFRALRKEFSISQTTVDRTLFELEREGFIYKVQGRGTFVADREKTEMERKGTIALIIPQINVSSFFGDIAQGVEDEAFKLGYQMIVCSSHEDISREKEYFKRLLNNNTEGIIYVSSSSEPYAYLHLDEIASRMPLTVIDVKLKTINCDYVTTDDEIGAYEAVTHFIRNGHRKIAILTTSKDASTMRKRLAGYKRALAENSIVPNDDLILVSPHCGVEFGGKTMRQAMKMGFDGTALFCCSDRLASGALQVLHEYDIKIPDDISVIGYGCLESENPYKKALSSVSQPAMEMGKRAVELLNEKLEKKRPLFSYKEIVLPTRLEIKET
jgi:DNA-binding LacI/PurR family transcriptional regulator